MPKLASAASTSATWGAPTPTATASEALRASAPVASALEVLRASTLTSVASATEGAPAPSDSWALTSRGVGSSSYACSVVTPVASPWVTGSFGSALADAAPRCMVAYASATHWVVELVLTLSALHGGRAGTSA